MNFSTLVELLQYRLEYQTHHNTYTFLKDGETETEYLNYQQLEQKARAIGAYLQSLNAYGTRVVLLYPPGLEFIAGFFGCLYAGAIAVPTYLPRPDQTLNRLDAIVTDAEAELAFTTTALVNYLQSRFAENPKLVALKLIATDNITNIIDADWHQPEINTDTLAFLQYTSGSTGAPKGVMISHGNIMHNLAMNAACNDLHSSSPTITWLPFSHNTGMLTGVVQPLYSDFPVIILSPLDFLQKPLRWLMAISQYKGVLSLAPNFAYDLVCLRTTPSERAKLDLSCWELAASGAEPIRAETIERFVTTFSPYGFRREAFTVAYGMAESVVSISGGSKHKPVVILDIDKAAFEQNRVLVMTNADETTKKIVGCGRTLLDQKIVIVNPESLTQCQTGKVGEIWISSPSVAQGYWKNQSATEETFAAYLTDTGSGPFLRTGDLGFLHDGELFVTGRLKDLIIIRGRNYYPQDIEFSVENCHPALQANCSAAFSIELESEERLVITQELKQTHLDNVDFNEVTTAIRQAVSKYHNLPIYAVLLLKPGTIPKTSSNKVKRHACRVGFLNESLETIASDIEKIANINLSIGDRITINRNLLAEVSTEEQQALLTSYLQDTISRILKVENRRIDCQQTLTDMGLDSLMIAELSSVLESELACTIDSTLIFDYPTVSALANYLVNEILVLGKPTTTLYNPLVAIQTGDLKTPFFCVPGSVGTVFYLHALATHLGCDQPFYGLQALGLDGDKEPLSRVEDIAANYIKAIQTIQPTGPYFIGGHSFGGKVAFEMSQQLQKQGSTVALLAIIDIPAPILDLQINIDWDDTKSMIELRSLFARLRGKKLDIASNDLAQLAPEKQLSYVIEQLQVFRVLPMNVGTKQIQGLVKVLQANLRAMANYFPREIYPTPIALFRAEEVHPWDAATWLSETIQREKAFGWNKFANTSLEIFSVPGDHVTMMVEPNVNILAQHLKTCLRTKCTC
ncbi:AMP-binding protein [Nostoc sp. C117]|uniref:AMP-binding protein n=1 Tax=Nostoc sp. C117 TaxID=3349875 RepID=UPI00370D5993